MARREKVVQTLTGGVSGLFKKNSIELIEGEAELAGAGAVAVGGQEIAAKTIVLATGSLKRAIPGTQFGERVIGTEEAWALDELPASMAVVGAGASGAEIASGYARLGTEVLLFEALERVLPSEDADISKLVERGLKQQGITVHTGTLVKDVARARTGEVHARRGVPGGGVSRDRDRARPRHRRARPRRRGRQARRGRPDRGRRRDANERRGRVRDRGLVPGPALAHKASDEGIIAVEDAAGIETHPIDYIDMPRATFCTPNVGSFGLTEAQAREQGHDVVVGKVQYGAVGAGTVYGDRTGLIKIVGEKKYGELLGGHIVGDTRDGADPGARQHQGPRGRLSRARRG